MEQTTERFTGFSFTPCESDCAALESVQFNEEIERIIAPDTQNLTSFTALLELPPAQAKEILHSPPNSDGAVAGAFCHVNEEKPQVFHSLSGNLTLPSDSALIERAAKFSAFAEKNSSPAEINLTPRPHRKVKSEPMEKTDSNPNQIEDKNEKAAKRKELEKEDKESSKKSKSGVDERCGDREKLPYIHVRARRGEATDSHSLAERARREKINARMKYRSWSRAAIRFQEQL